MSTKSVIDGVIGREGRYSNNPLDAGGETMWGITKAVARSHGYEGAMRDMPREMAVAIYTKSYVNEPGFNKVAVVSESIAEKMVDIGVNMGPGMPGPWLQRTLNLLNHGGVYPNLTVDGKIGPATVAALQAVMAKRGSDGELVVLRTLNCFQGVRYVEITEKREANKAFFFGWVLKRIGIL